MDRRTFLQSIAVTAFSSKLQAQRAPVAGRKAVLISMLPASLPYAERFAMARDAGFDAIEMQTISRADEAAQIREAAQKTGRRIHSVMNADHWRFPLSSSDRDTVNRSVAGMETSLRNAALWGADAVLLVPAVVDPATSYRDAWVRSQEVIRSRLLPLAQELKVIIAVEEVWNKFLLSPLEMLTYINEFKHPLIRAWFDVGNVVLYGYPQDWIHTLGSTIVKVHLKDFKRSENGYAWVNLGEGDIDWPAVRQAFTDVGYHGSAIAELQPGDEAYLRDVNKRIDRLLLGRS
jgi:L-ribulose-5-phosphate 3-epimerase